MICDESVDAMLTPDGFMLIFGYTVGAEPLLYVRMEGADYAYQITVRDREMSAVEASQAISRLYLRMNGRAPWVVPALAQS